MGFSGTILLVRMRGFFREAAIFYLGRDQAIRRWLSSASPLAPTSLRLMLFCSRSTVK